MSKTVIFSDSHLRHRRIDEILTWEEPYDRFLFTGDVWDQFGDTPAQNADAAVWLKEKLADSRNVILTGNHDFGYRFPWNENAYCSGFTKQKATAICAIMHHEDFQKVKLHHVESNILFSHAGIDRDWFAMASRQGFETPQALTLSNIDAWLMNLWPKIVELYGVGRSHPLMDAGRDRGGAREIGGIIWADFTNHAPIPFVNQIFGHTPQDVNKGPLFRMHGSEGTPTWRFASKEVNTRHLAKGFSLCFDTHNKHYLVLEDNVLTIKSVKWTRRMGDNDYNVSPGEIVETIDLSKIHGTE